MKNSSFFGLFSGLVLILALLLTGCTSMENLFWDNLTGDSSDGSGGSSSQGSDASGSDTDVSSSSSETSTRSAGPVSGPQWNQLMITRAQMAFTYAFSAGGLWAGQVAYKPGEFTEFNWTVENESPITIGRAYLKKLEDGNEWWRVSWKDSDGTWIWEALIEPESGNMLRMRAQDPDGNQGEVPVSGQVVYMPASELTKESVQGATVEKGKVVVPAGTFQADHVIYMVPGGEGDVEFWLAPQIPGGVVKYLISKQGEGVVWSSELVDFGKKATTVLNSF